MTKVLVTGASGALGRAVVAQLSTVEGYQVTSLGRQGEGDSTSVRCDIRNSEEFVAAVARVEPDVVLHLAAKFATTIADAHSINVYPAQRLLEFLQAAGSKTRVVLIGSAAEYGAVRPDENPVREDRVLMPVSAYGVSKAWQTQLVGYYAGRGVDVVCARVFNLSGPGVPDSLFAGRLQKQIDELKAGRRSVIEVGPLAGVRDYISTDEGALQLLSIAVRGESGGIYHVASGQPINMREFLMRELAANGLNASIVRESPRLSDRPGYDVPAIYADVTKTRRLEVSGNEIG